MLVFLCVRVSEARGRPVDTQAIGVLLDTFIIRSTLVPALAYDIGKRIWWPSKLAKADEPSAPVDEPAPVG